MIMESNIVVSIQCLVYNHEPYLRQCLDGFVMQKTNFKFEAIVHDDVSTDGSAAIIREYAEKYPDIIKPIFEKENQYSKHDGSLDRIMYEACRGKYIALCEGDDYWIDPLKLQKQVDFMDVHPDYSLCFTNIQILNEETRKIDENPLSNYLNEYLPEDKEELFHYIMSGFCRIQTMSVLFPVKFLSQIKRNEHRFMMGDTPLWLDLSQLGNFHYLPDKTGCYRVHSGSACRNQRTYDKFRLSMYEMRIYYCKKYGYNIPRKIKQEYNKCAIKILIDNGLDNTLLPYPLYKINLFQNHMIQRLLRRGKIGRFWELMCKVDDIMYAIYRQTYVFFRRLVTNYTH